MRGISFEVRAGEIVGIAGVDGNGQSELIDAITGLRKPESGRIIVGGRDLTGEGARRMPRRRASATSPRTASCRGLVLDFSLAENIALHDFREPPDSKFGWLFPKRLIERARRSS